MPFRRLIRERLLPLPNGGCPFVDVCGFTTGRREQLPMTTRCFNLDCEHVQRRQHDGIKKLWCDRACLAVIDMDRCPAGRWTRDGHGRPVLMDEDNR